MAQPVEGRGGSVRDDSLKQCPIPCRDVRCELQPCRPQFGMVREKRASEVGHAVSDSPEDRTARDQAIKGGLCDAGHLGLAAGGEARLVFGDVGQGAEGRRMRHHSTYPIVEGYRSIGNGSAAACPPDSGGHCSSTCQRIGSTP